MGARLSLRSTHEWPTSRTRTPQLMNSGQVGTASGNSFTQYNFAGLTKVSSNDQWDVRMTLQFQNRGDVTYYFEEG